MSLSKLNLRIVLAYEKGYRVIEGEPYNPRGIRMSIMMHPKGYPIFSFSGRNIFLHRLVGYQKYGDKIFEKGIVCRHLDGNPLNAKDDNIVIGTESQNSMDRPKSMRVKLAINASSKKRVFTDEEVSNIRKDRSNGMTYKQICAKYGTAKSTLSYLFNKAYY